MDKSKKMIINGMLTEYYQNIPKKIQELDDKIQMVRSSTVKAVSFDNAPGNGKTNDQKMVDMISTLDRYQKRKERLNKERYRIRDKLGINYLPIESNNVLHAVFTTKSYTEAGKILGYSKTQVYRAMEKLYERMQKNI